MTHEDDAPTVLELVATGQPVSDETLAEELYEVCDREHASCSDECPVYRLNGSCIPTSGSGADCLTFKDGRGMLDFIRDAHAARTRGFRLEQGATYTDGRGEYVTIVSRTRENPRWWWALGGNWYTDDGRRLTYDKHGHRPLPMESWRHLEAISTRARRAVSCGTCKCGFEGGRPTCRCRLAVPELTD